MAATPTGSPLCSAITAAAPPKTDSPPLSPAKTLYHTEWHTTKLTATQTTAKLALLRIQRTLRLPDNIDIKEFSNHAPPTVQYTWEDCCKFINEELSKEGLLAAPACLDGGATYDISEGTAVRTDEDFQFTLSRPPQSHPRTYFERFIRDRLFKLKLSDTAAKNIPGAVFNKFITAFTNAYLPKPEKEQSFFTDTLVTFDGGDFAFISNVGCMHFVSPCDGQLISLFTDEVWHQGCQNASELEAANKARQRNIYIVPHPERIIKLLFRLSLRATRKFVPDSPTRVVPIAIGKFKSEYPLSESDKLIRDYIGHLQRHYKNDEFGQFHDFLNLMFFLQGPENAKYCQLLAEAVCRWNTLRPELLSVVSQIKNNPTRASTLLALIQGVCLCEATADNAQVVAYANDNPHAAITYPTGRRCHLMLPSSPIAGFYDFLQAWRQIESDHKTFSEMTQFLKGFAFTKLTLTKVDKYSVVNHIITYIENEQFAKLQAASSNKTLTPSSTKFHLYEFLLKEFSEEISTKHNLPHRMLLAALEQTIQLTQTLSIPNAQNALLILFRLLQNIEKPVVFNDLQTLASNFGQMQIENGKASIAIPHIKKALALFLRVFFNSKPSVPLLKEMDTVLAGAAKAFILSRAEVETEFGNICTAFRDAFTAAISTFNNKLSAKLACTCVVTMMTSPHQARYSQTALSMLSETLLPLALRAQTAFQLRALAETILKVRPSNLKSYSVLVLELSQALLKLTSDTKENNIELAAYHNLGLHLILLVRQQDDTCELATETESAIHNAMETTLAHVQYATTVGIVLIEVLLPSALKSNTAFHLRTVAKSILRLSPPIATKSLPLVAQLSDALLKLTVHDKEDDVNLTAYQELGLELSGFLMRCKEAPELQRDAQSRLLKSMAASFTAKTAKLAHQRFCKSAALLAANTTIPSCKQHAEELAKSEFDQKNALQIFLKMVAELDPIFAKKVSTTLQPSAWLTLEDALYLIGSHLDAYDKKASASPLYQTWSSVVKAHPSTHTNLLPHLLKLQIHHAERLLNILLDAPQTEQSAEQVSAIIQYVTRFLQSLDEKTTASLPTDVHQSMRTTIVLMSQRIPPSHLALASTMCTTATKCHLVKSTEPELMLLPMLKRHTTETPSADLVDCALASLSNTSSEIAITELISQLCLIAECFLNLNTPEDKARALEVVYKILQFPQINSLWNPLLDRLIPRLLNQPETNTILDNCLTLLLTQEYWKKMASSSHEDLLLALHTLNKINALRSIWPKLSQAPMPRFYSQLCKKCDAPSTQLLEEAFKRSENSDPLICRYLLEMYALGKSDSFYALLEMYVIKTNLLAAKSLSAADCAMAYQHIFEFLCQEFEPKLKSDKPVIPDLFLLRFEKLWQQIRDKFNAYTDEEVEMRNAFATHFLNSDKLYNPFRNMLKTIQASTDDAVWFAVSKMIYAYLETTAVLAEKTRVHTKSARHNHTPALVAQLTKGLFAHHHYNASVKLTKLGRTLLDDRGWEKHRKETIDSIVKDHVTVVAQVTSTKLAIQESLVKELFIACKEMLYFCSIHNPDIGRASIHKFHVKCQHVKSDLSMEMHQLLLEGELLELYEHTAVAGKVVKLTSNLITETAQEHMTVLSSAIIALCRSGKMEHVKPAIHQLGVFRQSAAKLIDFALRCQRYEEFFSLCMLISQNLTRVISAHPQLATDYTLQFINVLRAGLDDPHLPLKIHQTFIRYLKGIIITPVSSVAISVELYQGMRSWLTEADLKDGFSQQIQPLTVPVAKDYLTVSKSPLRNSPLLWSDATFEAALKVMKPFTDDEWKNAGDLEALERICYFSKLVVKTCLKSIMFSGAYSNRTEGLNLSEMFIYIVNTFNGALPTSCNEFVSSLSQLHVEWMRESDAAHAKAKETALALLNGFSIPVASVSSMGGAGNTAASNTAAASTAATTDNAAANK